MFAVEKNEFTESSPAAIALDALSERHFRDIAAYIEREVGIRLPPTKRTMVEGRLRRRVKALGVANLDEYARLVLDGDAFADEIPHLIDSVTTNKTDFFREPDHFQALAQLVMPQLFASRRKSGGAFKFWSAAASIGAEAYTLAMVLSELSLSEPFDFRILGTDICETALAQARRAVYPADMLTPAPKAMRNRYVMQARDSARREVRIVPELRRLVRFQRLNLMDASYPFDDDIDVIFCRNVLIYFSAATQQAVVSNLCRHLRPGGFLFLGHSESMAGGKQPSMRQIASTVFRKDSVHT